jgi:nicotinamidase-related amidase
MTTGQRRDPRADHLITPENAALVVIDYQPSQVASARSIDHQLILKNVVSTAKTAKAFGLPIVHSTVNVASGRQKPTVPELAAVLDGNAPDSCRWPAHQLGGAGVRAATGLGAPRDRPPSDPDRTHRAPAPRMTNTG